MTDNPSNSNQWKTIINLIDILAICVQLPPVVYLAYIKARDKIQQIVSEDRDPTGAEYEELNKVIDSLRTRLHQPIEIPEE